MFIENYYKLLYSPLFIKIYSNALLPLLKQFLIIAIEPIGLWLSERIAVRSALIKLDGL
jgi:hypothetical protein